MHQAKKIVQMVCAVLVLLAMVVQPATAVEKKQKAKKEGPKPVGAVNSSNGGVYDKGRYGVIFKYFFFDQDQLIDGNDAVDYVRPKKGQTPGKTCCEKSNSQFQMTLRAGITDNVDARLIVPFFDKEMTRQSFNKDFNDSNEGIGDVKLISRYRLMSQKKKDPCNLAIGAGIKFPTGETDVQDSSGKCPGYLQTGSGSWDPIIEIGAHKVIGRHWLSSYLLYQLTTEGELGTSDYEKPDMFKYNVAYGFALTRLFDVGIELNGEAKGKAEIDGVTQENTGGHMLFLTPGIHVKFHKGMHCDVGVAIPVYRDLNGTQLSEDYRFIAKLAMTF